MAKATERLTVLKTSKLYIGGKFVRTESGRSLQVVDGDGKHRSNVCWASRKDLREAVRAARAAQPGWAGLSAYLRSQILYRVAEMLEDRCSSFAEELAIFIGQKQAQAEVQASIDRLVAYAGWCDKMTAVFGSVNPVGSPHFNFTVPEPSGVVSILCPETPSLLAMVSLMAAALVPGNTVILLTSESQPLAAAAMAEVLATSDVPSGVVNVLTGKQEELLKVLAGHLDVNAIVAATPDVNHRRVLQTQGAANVKRVTFVDLEPKAWFDEQAADPYQILQTVEMKTTWHPVGI